MDYYKICIAEAFEDAGIEATDEQRATVVLWIEGAVENEGLATGRDFIPNPLEVTVRELEGRVKTEEARADAAEMDFKMNVAMRHHCSPQDVILEDNGHAMVMQ